MEENWRPKTADALKHPAAVEDRKSVFRASKKLTDKDAKEVVLGVSNEDGFQAWDRLRLRFNPAVNARKGALLAGLTGMVQHPVKPLAELLKKLVDMDKESR